MLVDDRSAPGVRITVLANDTDVDGGLIQVQSVTQPLHGSSGVNPGGESVWYQPTPSICGLQDNFSYTLNGGSQAQVAVAVLCDASGIFVDGFE